MSNQQPRKPRNILYAEWALWVWTAWTCLFGIYEAWVGIPEIEKALGDQLQGQVSVSPESMLAAAIGGYVTVALTSAWVIVRIAQGKNWARLSLLLGLMIEIAWTALFPPGEIRGYCAAIIDFGLQIYAVYLLYTGQGRVWFSRNAAGVS